jgi:hypothetical protein
MKFIKFILVLLTLMVVPQVQAQYRLVTQTVTTNAIPATTTNTTVRSSTIVVTAGLDVAIQPQFNLADTGTDTIVLKFDESIDNSNWTDATRSISIVANGTNTVSKVSNFTVGAVGYLRLSQVQNPSARAIQNLVVKTATKVP